MYERSAYRKYPTECLGSMFKRDRCPGRSSFRDGVQVEFTQKFMRAFMDGYREENQIAPEWLERIPLLLKLREMDLYIIIHAEKAQDLNQWCRDFMDGRRERIENDIPVIDFDFSEFA